MKNRSQIEYIKTEKLIPYARNSRKHSPAQVQQIAASIKEFGFLNPILIRKTRRDRLYLRISENNFTSTLSVILSRILR